MSEAVGAQRLPAPYRRGDAGALMRLLLVVNTSASSVTARGRVVIHKLFRPTMRW